MKKHVVLLASAREAPTIELVETLSAAGIAVSIECLGNPEAAGESSSHTDDASRSNPLAVLCEIAPEARVEDLREIIELSPAKWPGVSLVACRTQSTKSRLLRLAGLSDTILKRIGFRAVSESATQLPALLRQVEDGPGTGELKLPAEFKSPLDSEVFSLPASVRGEHLRGALALLSSLHLSSNQKEAGQAALAGIARLVLASRWSIFLAVQTGGVDVPNFESLVARNASEVDSSLFDEDWRRELLGGPETSTQTESRSARAAVARIETVKKVESGRRVIALPLVSGERVLGVLEGVRMGSRTRQFSARETSLLRALAIPIASALANSVRIAEAERLSVTDDLTKLYNARYLRQFLVNEIKRARRYKSNVAALFLDLDDFKRINDVHGHLVGSHALMEVASVILPSVRDTDCVVRYGGDEFVVILPETGIEEGIQVADRIRAKIERHRFTGGRGLRISLTASFGIATFPQHALSPQQLIACADTAMYGAKAAHKNCVRVLAEPSRATGTDEVKEQTQTGISQFQRIPDEKLIC